jgi:hypothetical protein
MISAILLLLRDKSPVTAYREGYGGAKVPLFKILSLNIFCAASSTNRLSCPD